MADMITEFDTQVVEFKRLFAAAPTLVEFGQFQIADSIIQQLHQEVERELSPLMLRENPIWVAATNFLNAPLNDEARNYADDVVAAIKADAAFKDRLPVTQRAFSRDPAASEAWASAQYAAVWGSAGIVGAPFVNPATADKAIAAWRYERYKCGTTARGMGDKVILARSKTMKPDRSNYASPQIADARSVPAGNREVLRYNPTQLADAVAKIAAAVAKGYLYRFGVQSGMRHENQKNPYPAPEHYLLVFAQHGNNAFLFWDPDGTTSDIASRPWGEGFGAIYYRDDRLSTAYSDADFQNINGNYHLWSPKRHLYQVNAAIPLP